MIVTAQHNQSLLDLALQATGSVDNMLQIAMHNGLIPSEPLVVGTLVAIPDTVIVDSDILNYYQANDIVPATALTEELLETVVELTCEEKLYECFK